MVPQSAEAALSARIARARALALEQPASAELLTFYADLAEFQENLLVRGPADTTQDFRHSLPVERALAAVPSFLEWLSAHAPSFSIEHQVDWPAAMTHYISNGARDLEPQVFVVAALVQPLAERVAAAWPSDRRSGSSDSPACPVCGGGPVVGVLRPEGQGAKRSLVCAFCLTEHDFVRLVCASCGERRVDQLPVYTAEQFTCVRIDACDSCHRYLKTIDLTKNGLAVPVVDDIASTSLDLWAREHGYERLQENMLGL